MANQSPVGWLSTKAKTGLRDLPSNAAWVLSKALQPAKPAFEDISEGASAATDSVGAGAARVGRTTSQGISQAASAAGDTFGAGASKVRAGTSRARDSVVDNLPLLGGDNLESLIRQADQASEEAKVAEERAVVAAEEPKAAGEEAKAAPGSSASGY
jgi:hypothetical protein